MQDLRYALRTLRRQPIFTLVAVLTLTLGIGANTAIFSVVYQLLLRPLPYPAADRLAFIWNSYKGSNLEQASVSIPDYVDRKTEVPGIEDATLMTQRSANLNVGAAPEQLRALAVTPSFFSTLQREPFLGRAFTDDEAQPGADTYVILTSGLWKSHFASDPAIVGRDIRLNGASYRVVGVLPADFELPARDIALLEPFAFTPAQKSDQERGNEFSSMIARLRQSVTVTQVDEQIRIVTAHVAERVPGRAAFMRTSQFGGYAIPIRDQLVGNERTPLLIMQACVFCVLLIACANVANLLLMRATGRSRELAIRTTLGAGRWRIARQMLTEGLVLAASGGVGGLAAGVIGLRALVALTGDQFQATPVASLSLAVFGFAFGLVLITGGVFGVVPALAIARGNAASFLKDDSTRGTAGRRTGSLRTSLVVAEVAMALALLVAAGLLLKSFANLEDVNPGFSPDDVMTAQIALPQARYPDSASRIAFWTRLIEKMRAIPGVTAAGLTTNVPFNGMVGSGSYDIVGRPRVPGEPLPHGRQEVVGGEYFKAMRIPLVAGRVFSGGDSAGAPPVVVIDEYLVKKYFPNRSPLGRQIDRGDSKPYTIVGVVGTIHSSDLAEPVTKERLYFPALQVGPRSSGVILKTSVDPAAIVAQLRDAVRSLDPEQPIAETRTMDQWIGRSLETRRAPMTLLSTFAALALVLSGIGIYGVLAFGVAQRVREFGIRQALGADRASILALVLRQGMRTTAAGVALGLAASSVLMRYLESLLFGVTAHDAAVFAGVTGLLVVVALAACYVPARRATRMNPIAALRE